MRWLFWTLLMLNAVAAYWFASAADHRRDTSSALTAFDAVSQEPGVPILQLWHEAQGDSGPLQEGGSKIRSEDSSPPSLPPVEGLSSDQEQLCHLLGPFQGEELTTIKSVLGEQLGEISVIAKEVPVRGDFWLIVTPRETEKKAESLLMELRRKNIDSYLISDGEYRNGITLGVFSERENADAYQQTLKAKQVESTLIPREKLEKTFWLQLRAEKNNENAATLIAEALGIDEVAVGSREAAACQQNN